MSGTGPKAGGPHYLYRFVRNINIDKNEPENLINSSTESLFNSSKKEDLSPIIKKAEKYADAFDCISNNTRSSYLEYLAEKLSSQRDVIKKQYKIDFGLTNDLIDDEINDAILVTNNYSDLIARNVNHITFAQGPTGERNEYDLHNRGTFVVFGDTCPFILEFSSVLAASISIGNPLILLTTKKASPIGNLLVDKLVHPDLKNDAIFFYKIKNRNTLTNVFLDQRISGFYCFTNISLLKQLEKVTSNREGMIVPFLFNNNGQPLFYYTHNLFMISSERTITTNISAIGGNVSLYCMT